MSVATRHGKSRRLLECRLKRIEPLLVSFSLEARKSSPQVKIAGLENRRGAHQAQDECVVRTPIRVSQTIVSVPRHKTDRFAVWNLFNRARIRLGGNLGSFCPCL